MKYYITTPIYYVNDVPHIGSAYTTVVADCLARAHRQYGDEVLFLTGTDEHGAKIAQKARELGREPLDYANEIAGHFQVAWRGFSISHDRFARTTNSAHKKLVAEVLLELQQNGDIYEGQYSGWYCTPCEEYKDLSPPPGAQLREAQTAGVQQGREVQTPGAQLREAPRCEIHQKTLEWIEESVYYFALSRYQQPLIAAISSDELLVSPAARKNEALSFLTGQELRDIPVTRSQVAWGVPVPFAPEQTVYVWVDALVNYLSFAGIDAGRDVTLESIRSGETWWPANLQLIGKDILRFHAVIWPAFLLALGLPLPRKLLAHGFFTLNGQKMSKSLGNVITPGQLTERYGADGARYLIVSAINLGADGDISLEKMDAMYTADLANGVGNLLQRTVILINKFGIKPQVSTRQDGQVRAAYLADDLNKALRLVLQRVADANTYLATTQPWSMDNDAQRETVLVHAYSELLTIADGLRPVMPEASVNILKQLDTLLAQPLFPRLA